jgi:hypothetical protein
LISQLKNTYKLSETKIYEQWHLDIENDVVEVNMEEIKENVDVEM